MANMDDIIEAIVHIFYTDMTKNGLESVLYVRELNDLFPNVQLGHLELALLRLVDRGTITKTVTDNDETYYSLSLEVYEGLVNSKENVSNEWEPIAVENYEEVSEQADELAKAIRGENGYIESHPEEAHFISDKLKSFSEDLSNNEGKTLWKRVEEVFQSLKKLLQTFDQATRIGERAIKLVNFLSQFFTG